MADVFIVDGPVQIEFEGDTGGSTWEDLGHTSNVDRPQIEFRPLYETYSSDEEGEEPGAVINVGEEVMLFFTLVKYTKATLDKLINLSRGNAEGGTIGAAGTIGEELLVSNAGEFQIRMTPITAGKNRKTFAECMLAADGHRQFNMGNGVNHISLAIRVLRDSSGNYYTEDTTS